MDAIGLRLTTANTSTQGVNSGIGANPAARAPTSKKDLEDISTGLRLRPSLRGGLLLSTYEGEPEVEGLSEGSRSDIGGRRRGSSDHAFSVASHKGLYESPEGDLEGSLGGRFLSMIAFKTTTSSMQSLKGTWPLSTLWNERVRPWFE